MDHVVADAVADPEVSRAAEAVAGDQEQVLLPGLFGEGVCVPAGGFDEEVEGTVGPGHFVAHCGESLVEGSPVPVIGLQIRPEGGAAGNDPLHQALLDLQNNRQEEVQATIQALNLVQLRKVLSILRAAEIIEIEANGSSLPVAMDASLKLGSLGKRCMISPVPEKARSFASALTPKDALLLISSAGRCEALETAARAAKKNGTPVILITCDKRSALAGHASYTLLASNRIQRIASDMLPSQLSAALVVEVLYYLLLGNFDLN